MSHLCWRVHTGATRKAELAIRAWCVLCAPAIYDCLWNGSAAPSRRNPCAKCKNNHWLELKRSLCRHLTFIDSGCKSCWNSHDQQRDSRIAVPATRSRVAVQDGASVSRVGLRARPRGRFRHDTRSLHVAHTDPMHSIVCCDLQLCSIGVLELTRHLHVVLFHHHTERSRQQCRVPQPHSIRWCSGHL